MTSEARRLRFLVNARRPLTAAELAELFEICGVLGEEESK